MHLDAAAAYIAAVPADRMIQLPADVPVGATIAVIVLPQSHAVDDAARHERFARTRAALQRATERSVGIPEPDDEALDALIDRARRS